MTHRSWADSSRQVITSSNSCSLFFPRTFLTCSASLRTSSAGNSWPSKLVILTSLTLSLPARASKNSSRYFGSLPRSTWKTTSRASRLQAELDRIFAHPSSSRGEQWTRGAWARSFAPGQNPGPAPTSRHMAATLPSEAPAAFSRENIPRGGTWK